MFYRFENLKQFSGNPHLSAGKGGLITGRYMSVRVMHKGPVPAPSFTTIRTSC